jgi:hypothetical protein
MAPLQLQQLQSSSLSSQTSPCLFLNEVQSVHSLQSVLSTSDLLQLLVLATHKYSQYISCLPSITYHPESLTFHTSSTLVTSSKLLIISLLPTVSTLFTTGTLSTLLRLIVCRLLSVKYSALCTLLTVRTYFCCYESVHFCTLLTILRIQ